MVIQVQADSSSLNAQRSLLRTNNDINTGFQRQASGQRINSARDDAAGLAIANQLSSQIISQNVGIRNANDGISIAQVADGALQEVGNILQRTRELALSAASGTNSDEGRAALNAEFQALGEEITRIADGTEFGGQNLLSGGNSFDIQVGTESGQNVAVETPNISDVGSAIEGIDISTAGGASAALDIIDQQIASVDAASGALGASQNRLTSSISNTQNVNENAAASRSRIQDADFATLVSNQARDQVLQDANIAVQAQANVARQAALILLN